VKDVDYDVNEGMFMQLVHAIALSTTSIFSYNPTDDVVRSGYLKKNGLDEDSIPAAIDKQSKDDKKNLGEYKKSLIEAESKKYFIKRNVEGDASETGLVKFAMPILMKEYGGPYDTGMDGCREAHPVCKVGADRSDAMIPFSSAIKFNAIIRDMNPSVKKPTTAADNMTVFMKGAPERVLERCQTILVNDNVVAYDPEMKYDVAAANDRFGLMGERVLAFARVQLDPQIFTKDPEYQFDVKTWNTWKDIKEYNPNTEGWFNMWDLTLLGLVSLNDPPRPRVDASVLKCRAAGIQVIMVTGDQPPTAAAIAHKVNIIKDPTMEYAKLRVKYLADGLSEADAEERAFKECESIVIHGDTLA